MTESSRGEQSLILKGVPLKYTRPGSSRRRSPLFPIFIIGLLLAFALFFPLQAGAVEAVMDCEGTIKAWVISGYYRSGECYCSGGKPVCSKSSSGGSSSTSPTKTPSLSRENDIKLQLFQGVLDGMMKGPKINGPSRQQIEAQKEAERQKQQQRAQREMELELERQKYFDDKKSQLLGDLKGGSGALADFKYTAGDAETIRKAAGDPFDQSSGTAGKVEISAGTNFFGTTLSKSEITTLMEPEKDPVIVDLSEARTFVVQSLKQNEEAIKKIEVPKKEEVKHNVDRPECKDIVAKYNKQVGDMEKFQKQIEFTKNQLDDWRQKNDAAFWNAVVDGASFAVGEYFDYLKETRSGAQNIKRNLELIETRLINEKVYTPAQIASLKTKLNLRMAEYTLAKHTSEFTDITDYFDYVKNVIQSSVTEIGKTDADVKEFLSNPRVKEYINESPTVDAAQFLAGKAMTEYLAKKGFTRYSYVGIAQLAVNTAYNATDMYLSYKNICTLNKAFGTELESAKRIQRQISDTYGKIVLCNK